MEKDWVCVFQTGQSFQAEIAKEILENEEIQCVILNEHDTSFPSVGEIEVMVHKDFKEKATELLKDLIN
jgi:Putative prokaryotic signal transducing protein